jgi:hypothetical protein
MTDTWINGTILAIVTWGKTERKKKEGKENHRLKLGDI